MVSLLEHYFQKLNVICVIKYSQSISCQSVLWNFCILSQFLYTTVLKVTQATYTAKILMSSTSRENVLFCVEAGKIFCHVTSLWLFLKTNNVHNVQSQA